MKMELEEEIKAGRQEISTDAYGMSIGEIISLYQTKELKIRPEFQRYFRWTAGQKSRFVESLLLGIPIPPIFVSQDEHGKWEVIDGLQRLSTILQLTGDLLNEDNRQYDPLILTTTNYLPHLNNTAWNGNQEKEIAELPASVKLLIKRARLDLKIVLNTSDPSSKFELFDRLNTGGSSATDQEVRNCILIMANKSFFDWFLDLSKDENFKACLPLSDRQIDEQYNLELASRFLVFRNIELDEIQRISDLGSFVTRRIVEFAQNENFDREEERTAFTQTFRLLADSLGEDSFRRYDHSKSRSMGGPLISVFEVMAIGLGYNHKAAALNISQNDVVNIHHSIWKNKEFTSGTGSGVRATSRLPITIPLGRRLFNK